jgi:hypothetical protein
MQNVPFHLDDVIVVAVRPNPPTINLKETLCQRLFILLRELFQYRVVIKGNPCPGIAPAEDLEILDGVVDVICPCCHCSFQGKPALQTNPAAAASAADGFARPA